MANIQVDGVYTTRSNGIVVIYKITVTEEEPLFGEFYVVSFDDTSSEQPWGIGTTPRATLENAAREWENTANDPNSNPFKEVLETFFS
jgi:hypothetical protein